MDERHSMLKMLEEHVVTDFPNPTELFNLQHYFMELREPRSGCSSCIQRTKGILLEWFNLHGAVELAALEEQCQYCLYKHQSKEYDFNCPDCVESAMMLAQDHTDDCICEACLYIKG